METGATWELGWPAPPTHAARLPMDGLDGPDGPDEPEAETEAGLSARALSGDRAAWDALVARHERRVLLTLLARGVRLDQAKDILQDTWARLFDQARAGRLPRLDLPGLAIKQAAWLALDAARRSRPERPADVVIDEPEANDDVADGAASIEERLCTRAELASALAELDACPPKAREVFAIVYDEPEIPHAQVAARVGLSVQRLRQTLCEVRARLRTALERSDEPS